MRDILGYIRVPDPNVPGRRLRQQPVHRHRSVSVRQSEPAPGDRGDGHREQHHLDRLDDRSVLHRRRRGGQQQTPLTIDVTFSEPIDPSTLTSSTVQLEELGIAPGTTQQFINLSGKLSYNSATNTAGHQPGSQRVVASRPMSIASSSSAAARRSSPTPRASLSMVRTSRNGDDPTTRDATRPPLRQRLSGRQLLRHLHHQHDPAVRHHGHARSCRPPAIPTSWGTTSRTPPRRRSSARSPSPTRRWYRSRARRPS